ncbi:MAG: transglutaminase domain-containing protein [Marivibrio sp.]|uniref:transglutaminase domain-containing protein n=1 Tax=Marivibrio sp. TaxID=2039719 RepID=UPI0032EBD618
MTAIDFTHWRRHSAMSDPGAHRSALKAACGDGAPSTLVRVAQGLLLHDWAGSRLYGPPPAHVLDADRTTLPTAQRLERILAADPRPLDQPRAPFDRSVGTCRDMALLVTALARSAGRAARVRCGFAAYLAPGFWEDHWICEIEDQGAWRRLDAQLDAAHRAALATSFDPSELPPETFLDGPEAWRRIRCGAAKPALFRHGEEAVGAWFVRVNLARDQLARTDRLVSEWDRWRCAAWLRRLDARAEAEADRWAAETEGRG